MRHVFLTGTLLVLMSTTAVASQVYKWVDAQGITHFGAQPPAGQHAMTIDTKTSIATPPKGPEKPTAPTFESIADPEQAQIDKKVKAEVAAKAAERKQYCTDVRTSLAQLENNPRLRTEVNGEMRRLDEDERQQRITETKKAISENCD